MKIIFASIALLLACTASQAATIALKNVGPTTGAYRWQCAATGFSDGGIVGACMERYYSAGSGRGGGYRQPTLMGIWLTTWDTGGNPVLDPSTPVSWPGCQGTGSVVTIDNTPFYLIAGNPLGDMLVENACQSYLVTP